MPKITRGAHTFHLGYCMNVHAAEDVPQVHETLEKYVLPLRQVLAPDAEFGVGLRLGGRAVNRLWFNRNDRARLKDVLAQNRLVAFTLNGFPIGDFHAGQVKEQVFRPSWLEEARVNYTCQAADVLADLCGSAPRATISTVPGSFKPWGDGPEVLGGICRNLVRAAVHMHKLHERTGKEVMVCLEPEPFGTLETTEETIRFFRDWVWAKGKHQIMEHLNLAEPAAEASLERHLGVCFDTCHQAVEFEDLPASLRALGTAGVPIGKIQLSCALSAQGASRVEDLRPFAEDRYFHQVIGRGAGHTRLRCLDLPDLLRDPGRDWLAAAEWRTHYHVPIHLAKVGPLATTQADLAKALDHVVATGASTHLEVETYTWDVLPQAHRRAAAGDDLLECLRRELSWVIDRLK